MILRIMKYSFMCEAHIIREAYFICRRHISLIPPGMNFIEKTSFYNEVFSGGEGGIRTLEPFYRLHDFQSCALDQARRLLHGRLASTWDIIASKQRRVKCFFRVPAAGKALALSK